MLTKLPVILERKVNLIVIRTNHLTTQEVTIVLSSLVEITLSQIIVISITTCGSIKVHTATITVTHFINIICRTILIGLASTDTLGIRKTDFQALQDITPSEVISDTTIDSGIRIHIFGKVTMILKDVIMIGSEVVTIRCITNTIGVQSMAIDILRKIIRTSQKSLIVFCSRTTYRHIRRVLLAIVTTDIQISRQPLANLYVNTCTIIPTVIIQITHITILLKVTYRCKVVHIISSTTYIYIVLLGVTGLPILVQQIVVQVLHSLQFIRLKELSSIIQRGVLRVASIDNIHQTPEIISTQHRRTRDLVGNTETTIIRDTGSTLLTFFRGHKNDTVSRTGTINCCCCILQDRDTLHFRWIQIAKSLSTRILTNVTHLYIIRINVTINNVQRLR